MDVILALAAASLLLGAVLLWIGRRGRRVDDHPVCRKCRFDLDGVYPENKTCPECGRGLETPKAVRVGNRRRRRSVFALGGGLAALALVLVGLMVTLALGGSNLNPYKPLWMLRLEAQGSDVSAAGEAIDELMERYDDDALSARQVDALVELAIARHAIVGEPNEPAWIETIERLHRNGELADEQFSQYLAQALVFSVDARARAKAGEPIPIRIVVTNARWGASRGMLVDIALAEAGRAGPDERGMFFVRGQVPRGHTTSTMTRLIGPRTTPGRQRLKLSVRLRVRDASRGSRQPQTPVLASIDRAFNLHTEVIEGEVVEAVAPTGKLRAAMRAAVAIQSAQDTGVFELVFSGDDPPMDGVFNVVLRIDGQEHAAPDSPSVRIVRAQGATRVSSVATASALQFIKDAERVDIILRPDLDAAERTTDFEEIYGEDLVFEDVPIERPGG